jgi:hypothetical protein
MQDMDESFDTEINYRKATREIAVGLCIAFTALGALRSGLEELAETHGQKPDDGIGFTKGILVYGWQNVKDGAQGITDYIMEPWTPSLRPKAVWVQEADKPRPSAP